MHQPMNHLELMDAIAGDTRGVPHKLILTPTLPKRAMVNPLKTIFTTGLIQLWNLNLGNVSYKNAKLHIRDRPLILSELNTRQRDDF